MQNFLEFRQKLGHIGAADNESRKQPDNVVVGAINDQALLKRFRDHRPAIDGKVYSDDQSLATTATVWNMENRTPSASFKFDSNVRKLMLSPDGSQFYAELAGADFKFFDIATKKDIRYAGNEGHGWAPHLGGILISCQWNNPLGHCLTGQLPDDDGRTTRLWFPRGVDVHAFTVGSSACAVGSYDGRIFLVRPPTTHFN